MTETRVDDGAVPGPWLLGLGVAAATGFSLVAWLLMALNMVFSWDSSSNWLYTGFALPAASIGAVLGHRTRRPVYVWVGLAVTFIPLIAFVWLDATAPPAPPGWND